MEANRAPRIVAEDNIVAVYKASNRVRRIFGTVRDISKTGVFFYADFRPQEGSAIQLALTFPREVTYADPVPVRCQGRVVRVESNGSGHRIGIAVQIRSSQAAAGR
jgi:PilZ domain-containing protein